jgi:hypothetical protein
VIDRRRRTVGALAAIGGGVLASAMLVGPALAADEAVTIAGFAYDPADNHRFGRRQRDVDEQ